MKQSHVTPLAGSERQPSSLSHGPLHRRPILVRLACLLVRLEHRRLERHIITAFDSDLSRRLDRIVIAQEALEGQE